MKRQRGVNANCVNNSSMRFLNPPTKVVVNEEALRAAMVNRNKKKKAKKETEAEQKVVVVKEEEERKEICRDLMVGRDNINTSSVMMGSSWELLLDNEDHQCMASAWLLGLEGDMNMVDEQMSWGSTWFPSWDMDFMGDAAFTDVLWDYDLWNLNNQIPIPNSINYLLT